VELARNSFGLVSPSRSQTVIDCLDRDQDPVELIIIPGVVDEADSMNEHLVARMKTKSDAVMQYGQGVSQFWKNVTPCVPLSLYLRRAISSRLVLSRYDCAFFSCISSIRTCASSKRALA